MWRKFNRILHRDTGYFFFGMAIIYGLSGIALNHIDDWDPSYIIRNEKFKLEPNSINRDATRKDISGLLVKLDIHDPLKQFYYPDKETLKAFTKGGSLTVNLADQSAVYESVKRRQVFFQVNYLHYNNPGILWTYFADFFGGALVFMAFSGIIMLQGKKGFFGQGKWFVIAGILIPVIFLLIYLG
jgi:hypothetical protein